VAVVCHQSRQGGRVFEAVSHEIYQNQLSSPPLVVAVPVDALPGARAADSRLLTELSTWTLVGGLHLSAQVLPL